MTSLHGSSSRALRSPDGTSGSFGRMFPHLPGRQPTGLEAAKAFGLPGGKMDGGGTTADQENPELPSGFTYFGQFIDHDLTLDVMSQLGQSNEPGNLTDFRTPRLDMDNMYGSGPTVNPHLYDPDSHETKLALSPDGADLARTSEDVALIGDPRNDENMLLAQFHLALIKFHNNVVDELRGGRITDAFGQRLAPQPPDEPPTEQPGVPLAQLLDVENYYNTVFSEAQRLVRWHYQWLVVHEFLMRVADQQVVQDVEKNGPQFFTPGSAPFIPVEFAAAAYRFGHPTVRSAYRVNDDFVGKIFPDNPDAPAVPRQDLRGGPVLPEHAVDWSHFFPVVPGKEHQFARRILASLNTQLLDLPVSAVPGAKEGALARPVASLVVRNLLRSEALALPSGQDVARKVGEAVLTDEELETTGPVYLWYYILKEAEVRSGGLHLGPVGSRIVAEVLIGLMDADPSSYRFAHPAWRPTLADRYGRFTVSDLLRFAGAVQA
ncbi:heme peroxidase family protein [Streptomyces sp. N2-109]|uniref:Heme peroxidase family protein n=1 Tax=Streptomyces gossypii TaxID=2883101 RepID=A0ABT2JVY9_9ACTN|nr:heme peroxidase family protein [Streptomyces gossypii]MCT2591490.1 heme peroxidase family protein [Streptomyces gossypii]